MDEQNLDILSDDECNCYFCLANLIIPHNEKLILYFKKSIQINNKIDKFFVASPVVNSMRNYDTIVL